MHGPEPRAFRDDPAFLYQWTKNTGCRTAHNDEVLEPDDRIVGFYGAIEHVEMAQHVTHTTFRKRDQLWFIPPEQACLSRDRGDTTRNRGHVGQNSRIGCGDRCPVNDDRVEPEGQGQTARCIIEFRVPGFRHVHVGA